MVSLPRSQIMLSGLLFHIQCFILLLLLPLAVECRHQVHAVDGEDEGQARVDHTSCNTRNISSKNIKQDSEEEDDWVEGGEDQPGQKVGRVLL